MTSTTEPILAEVALRAARRGAEAIALEVGRARGAGTDVDKQTKDGNSDFVTAADLAAEREILALLASERPEDSVLAEESGEAVVGTSGYRWLVDPLDGTMNFVHHRIDYAVSVGVEVVGDAHPGEQSVAGAVVIPQLGWEFAASATGSVVTASVPLQTSGVSVLTNAMVGVGYPRGDGPRGLAHAWLGDLLPDVRDYRRMGSAACDLVSIATGSLDVYIAFGVQPWDVAAGFALVRVAGGRAGWVPSASGRQVAVATTADLYEQVTERVGASDF
jgi:myo-inositol-1(or 4)-monophosphatase